MTDRSSDLFNFLHGKLWWTCQLLGALDTTWLILIVIIVSSIFIRILITYIAIQLIASEIKNSCWMITVLHGGYRFICHFDIDLGNILPTIIGLNLLHATFPIKFFLLCQGTIWGIVSQLVFIKTPIKIGLDKVSFRLLTFQARKLLVRLDIQPGKTLLGSLAILRCIIDRFQSAILLRDSDRRRHVLLAEHKLWIVVRWTDESELLFLLNCIQILPW